MHIGNVSSKFMSIGTLNNPNILYEDNHIIVVIKPTGILSQEDRTKEPDMVNIIKNYLKIKYKKEGNVYLGLVHRLDRNTSGIMVFAKTSKAAKRLSEQISSHSIVKKYLAIVEGNVEDEKRLTNYLYKDEKIVKSFVVDEHKGKLAILDFKKLAYVNNTSLIDVTLHTGRHHQIRVQMSNYKHPLVGDTLYGSKFEAPYYLHAYYLAFLHPVTKEQLTFTNFPSKERWETFNLQKYQ